MAEYIERAAFVERVKDIPMWGSVAAMFADAIPSADVAQVMHGEWKHIGGDEWCCTACGFVISTEGSWEKPEKKFCENCGAKMDGGADNG